jgi:hypothetical protein
MFVNRSVITGMIAAGAVCAGPALATAPTALADSVDTVGATAKGDNDDGTVRRPGRSRAGKPALENRGDRPDKPCAWSVIWSAVPVNLPPRDSDIGVLPAGIVPAVPLPPSVAGAAQFDVPDRDTDDSVPAPAAPLAIASVRPAAPVVTPPPPPAAMPPRAAPAVPPAPPPQRPAPMLSPADPPWSGHSEAVRVADTARIVASALPGLAALAGITALGGLVGYRQARAGYLVRAAGAGRFLQ